MVTINQPGLYADLDHADYIADPVPGGSLSASGARRLLPPSCPAKFRWWADNPEPPKAHFDLGTAAHHKVLGIGPGLHVTHRESWNTAAVKAEVADARAAGLVPLKPSQAETVQAMAAALGRHPLAGRVFDLDHGTPEPSLFWQHYLPDGDPKPVWRRCRLDWLNHPRPGQRLIVPDYKTTDDASPQAITKALWAYGYHIQGQTQVDAVTALGLAGDTDQPPAFVLVAQEKTPPYVVTIVQVDAPAMRWARRQNDAALRLFARCQAEQRWPDYGGWDPQVLPVGLPRYAEYELDSMIEDGTLEALQ